MPDAAAIAGDLVAALNARDYAAIAALCDEDVALSGIGAGSDQGREALRERLARHFAAGDESFGDAVVMQAVGGSPVAIRVTAGHPQQKGPIAASHIDLDGSQLAEDGGEIERAEVVIRPVFVWGN